MSRREPSFVLRLEKYAMHRLARILLISEAVTRAIDKQRSDSDA